MVIACASFVRLGRPSCLPVPFGPSLEKRNGGTAAGAATSAAGRPSTPSVLPPSDSPRKPSPTTKYVSEPCRAICPPRKRDRPHEAYRDARSLVSDGTKSSAFGEVNRPSRWRLRHARGGGADRLPGDGGGRSR